MWADMSRFYFDVREGNILARDNEGAEYESIDTARDEAIRSLAEMACEAVRREPKN